MIPAVTDAELQASAPVILLGRGGSGTRLLSDLALLNGVFLGNRLNASQDSVEWLEVLYPLALEAIAGVAPGSGRDAFWCARTRQQAAGILGAAGLAADSLWGWKLPETMLALPQVLRAFPRARVVHLVRHPVGGALRRTHTTSRMDNPIGQAVLPAAYRACGMDPAAIPGDPAYLHNAASWQFQVGGVLAVLQGIAGDGRVLHLRYEDVCADPGGAQRGLARFLGLPVPGGTIAAGIDLARAAPVSATDDQVEQVWSICGRTAAALGYGRAGAAA